MRLLVALLLMAPALLAGCAGTDIPADAVEVRSDEAPGALVHAWIEQDGGAVVFHGVFRYDGDGYALPRQGEWPKPWILELRDGNGTALHYFDRELYRDFWYEPMVAGTEKEFEYTWQRQAYDADGVGHVVPDGDYTAIIGFSLGRPRVDLNATVPFVLGPVA